MPVTLTKAPARGDCGGPLLRLVLLALAVFLCGWSLTAEAANIPVRSGSAGRTSWNVETSTLDSVVAATEASVQIGRDIVARIGYGGKQIGTVAAMEVSSIGMADVAAVVARSAGPAMIALMIGDLAVRGVQRCLESGTGWCKKGQANPAQSDEGFTGFIWRLQDGVGGSYPSASAACKAYADRLNSTNSGSTFAFKGFQSYTDASAGCVFSVSQDGVVVNPSWGGVGVVATGSCVSGYVQSGSKCVPDPNVSTPPVPMTYPDIAAAWNAQMAANPNRVADYWKQMSPDEQAQAQQNAQRQPTQMKGTDTVSDPNVSTSTTTNTKPDGTVQQCTTTTGVRVQARSNNSATAASSPLNYQTTATNTRTCPDGTTTTNTNTDSGDTAPSGGGGAKPEVKMCGLADTAACKIDETGTPTYKEPTVAKDKMDDADNRLKTKLDSIGGAKGDQFGIGDIVKPLEGACAPFAYAIPKGAGVESVDIDLCPTLDLTRTGATWVWVFVSAVACILLVRDAINGG